MPICIQYSVFSDLLPVSGVASIMVFLPFQYIGISGVVMSIDNDGDLMVNYHGNAMFHVNAAAVTKVRSNSVPPNF